MKKIFSYNLTHATSINTVVKDYSIELDNNYDVILGICMLKITGAENETNIIIQDDEKILFNKVPSSAVWLIGSDIDRTAQFLPCHIPVINNKIRATLTADVITTAVSYDIMLLLGHLSDKHEPVPEYDFQMQRFIFYDGQTEWTDGVADSGTTFALKNTENKIAGLLVHCPTAGRLAIKDANMDYLLNRIYYTLIQYDRSLPFNKKFFPFIFKNTKNLKLTLEYKPDAELEDDTYIDVVFLIEKINKLNDANINDLTGKKIMYAIRCISESGNFLGYWLSGTDDTTKANPELYEKKSDAIDEMERAILIGFKKNWTCSFDIESWDFNTKEYNSWKKQNK